jgi:hypothetical protein
VETLTKQEQKAVVRQAIAEFIEFLNAAAKKHTEEHFPMLDAETYWVEGGQKYIKIACGRSFGQTSVHCFVDALTGDVYKAAGWKAPALNGARYNLLDEESLVTLKAKWDPYGGYLYKR